MSDRSPEPVFREQGGELDGHAAELGQPGADVADDAYAGLEIPESERPSPPAGGDLCRLTIYGPTKSAELAIPVHVPLVDLLPALAGHLGDNLADAGLEHGGWVLQRLGEPPLREELSTAALGLHDGDVLHLRSRTGQLPPMDFDDLIHGIAVGAGDRPDKWRPQMSRYLLAGLLGIPLATGAGVLAARPSTVALGLAVLLAVLLLGCTAVASRAFGERVTARVLGVAAIAYAAIAGASLPLLRYGPHGLLAGVRPGAALLAGAGTGAGAGAVLLAGGAAAAGTALVVTMVIAGRDPGLVGLTTAAALTAAGGALAAFARLGPAAVAAVLLSLIMPLGAAVPVSAFRLARLRLDPMPTTPDELHDDLDPVPGEHVLDRARWADHYMTALYCALAGVAGGCLTVLGFAAGLAAHVVAADAIVLLLLHARALVAARHRLAVMIAAAGGAAIQVVQAGLRADAQARLVLLAGLMVTAGLLWTAERTLPGRRLMPLWGRAGDVLEMLAALALIPATLWLLNMYQFARTVKV